MKRTSPVAAGGLLLLAAALLTLLASLGFWQLDRARQKETARDEFARRADAPALDAAALAGGGAAALRFRRVRLAGRYDPAHQYLLDNRTRDGVAGYEVHTPLQPAGGGPLVLVNRGWVPAGARRADLPAIGVPATPVSVQGTLAMPRTDLFLLGEAGYGAAAGWPRVVQRIEPQRIAEQLDSPVAPVVVQLDPESAHGFRRDWTPYLGIGPDRHRGYAFQWFALATTLLVLVALLVRRARRRTVPESR